MNPKGLYSAKLVHNMDLLAIILLITETIVRTSTQIDIYGIILKSIYKDMANSYEKIDSNYESNENKRYVNR
jgi:hypothetical protein